MSGIISTLHEAGSRADEGQYPGVVLEVAGQRLEGAELDQRAYGAAQRPVVPDLVLRPLRAVRLRRTVVGVLRVVLPHLERRVAPVVFHPAPRKLAADGPLALVQQLSQHPPVADAPFAFRPLPPSLQPQPLGPREMAMRAHRRRATLVPSHGLSCVSLICC